MVEYNRKFNSKKRNRKVKGKGLTKKQKVQVERMLSVPVEKKCFDNSFSSISISLTPQFYDLFVPNQGVLSTERVGTQAKLINISYKLRFLKADTTNYIRMVLFQWHPDNANDVPQWSQMFQFNPPVTQHDIMGPLIMGDGNQRNFRVIKSIDFNLDDDGPVSLIHGYINKGYKNTIYFADQAVTGMEHIYVMFVSDSGSIQHPIVDGYFRFRYTDE